MTTLGPRFGGGFGGGRPATGFGLKRAPPLERGGRAGIGSATAPSAPAPAPALTPAQSAARRETQQILAAYTNEKQSEIDPAFKETLMEFGITEPDGSDKSLGGIALARLNVRPSSDSNSPTSSSSPFAGSRDMLFGSAKQDDFVHSPLKDDHAPLQMSENGFAIKAEDKMDEMEKLTRNVNRIMNKLTPEKYHALAPQLYEEELGVITNEEYMQRTIELLFSRAIAQPAFVEMYAQLAEDLAREELRWQKRTTAPDAKVSSKFRTKLLGVVQQNYQNTEEMMKEEGMESDKEKVRKRKFGNVRFVGELFNKGVLPHTIIFMLYRQLLCLSDTAEPIDKLPPGEDLEVLCKLLTTTGKCFELTMTKKGLEELRELYDKMFQHMDRIAEGNVGKYELRIRITLVNTIDLRRKGWPVKIEVAKKLVELERENEEKERRRKEAGGWNTAADVAPALLQAQREKDKGRVGGKKKKKANNDDEGWGTVKGSTRTTDNNSPKMTNQPKTTAGAYAAFGKAEKTKGKAKEKEPKKESKKEKKELKKAKKESGGDDEDKKGSRLPPAMPEGFGGKVKNRALECMEQREDEHAEIIAEDFDHYKSLALEEYVPLVVHEILRAITALRDEQQRKALLAYLTMAVEAGRVDRADIMRGVGWWVYTAVSLRLYEDMPAVYKRTGDVLKAMFPLTKTENWIDMTKTFQHGYRAIAKWWDHTAEEDRPVDSVDELFDEVTSNCWCPLNRDLGGIWEEYLFGNIATLNVKAKFPKTSETTYVLQEMAEHLLAEGNLTKEHLRAYCAKNAGGKADQAVQILRPLAGDADEAAEEEEQE